MSTIYGFYEYKPVHLIDWLFNKRLIFLARNGYPGAHKRKERSREAARHRRNQENELFKALAHLLPLHPEIAAQLDKASIVRLVVSYVKLQTFIQEIKHAYMPAEWDNRQNSIYERGNSTAMDWILSELLQKICLQIKMAFSEDYKICWYLGIALILQPMRVSELSTSSQAYVLRLTDDLCIQYIEKSPASEITTLPVMLHKTLYQHVDPFELNNLRSSHLERIKTSGRPVRQNFKKEKPAGISEEEIKED
ncbi:hypoxia-inducible factor 1 alpha [Clonorchis sinensis]|uniref:Hypoxia-inducible factor 1 alpha n=1 Tax=Clonorchis sinensis TaxID=79923 RepID=G7YSS7_CLOSI|nr:hypoxia-inducible factor 1 alpha [Clonorchis sinensis]